MVGQMCDGICTSKFMLGQYVLVNDINVFGYVRKIEYCKTGGFEYDHFIIELEDGRWACASQSCMTLASRA